MQTALKMRAAAGPVAKPARSTRAVVCKAQKPEFGQMAASALAATTLMAGSAQALTYDQLQSLTYLQVKGSGVAMECPVIANGEEPKALKAGSYKMEKFCMEPTSFKVKDESPFRGGSKDFVETRLLTRLTYGLSDMSGTFKVDGNGNAEMKEEDGFDFAALTLQLPGGERVPMLFSVKELDAKGPLDAMTGDFESPSYRGSSFLDPKGRGGSTGYDAALALPAKADSEELLRENIKVVKSGRGIGLFSVVKVDNTTGEVAGVFETLQPADSDMGAKDPKDVKISGLWYAQLK